MKIAKKTERGLVCSCEHRKAGESIIDGKKVEWRDADILTVIPWLDEKGLSKKLTIDPLRVREVEATLADAGWACVVDYTLAGKNVVAVKVVHDFSNDLPDDSADLFDSMS